MRDDEETCCGLRRDDWGWLLLGVGAFTTLATVLRRHRWPSDWLLPLGLTAGGLALLLEGRSRTIDEAERRVSTELDALDAIGRAQVIKRVAAHELGLGDDQESSEG